MTQTHTHNSLSKIIKNETSEKKWVNNSELIRSNNALMIYLILDMSTECVSNNCRTKLSGRQSLIQEHATGPAIPTSHIVCIGLYRL